MFKTELFLAACRQDKETLRGRYSADGAAFVSGIYELCRDGWLKESLPNNLIYGGDEVEAMDVISPEDFVPTSKGLARYRSQTN